MHTRVVYVAGLLVVVAVVGAVTWRVLGARSTYEEALDTLPGSTLRVAYIDWNVAREAAGGKPLTDTSPQRRVAAFLGRATTADLVPGSAVAGSTQVLSRRYGFSALDAEWEALGTSASGSVDVLKLDGVDMAALEPRLRRLGYVAAGPVWTGSPALVTSLAGTSAPLLRHLVVLPDQHLVLLSDSAGYVSEAASVARGSGSSVLHRSGVGSLADAAGDPSAAVQWAGAYACRDLAMSAADPRAVRVGRALVARAGGVSPLAGLVMAQHADRTMVLGMRFSGSSEASRNLRPRMRLARGPAPGQGGSFRDRFRVASSDANGRNVVLQLQPIAKRPVLSDLSSGPVLFAAC